MFKIIDVDFCTIDDIKEACKNGFFYVPIKYIETERIINCCNEYFSRPIEFKRFDKVNEQGIGYTSFGRYNKEHDIIEAKESFNYRSGEINSVFSDTYDHYIKHVSEYAKKIFNLIIRSLEKEPIDYEHTVSPSFDTLSIIHYPQGSNKCGMSPHTDWGYLTLLLTIGDGLQVNVMDQWIDVPVLENHFIVNIGDMLEILSSGCYKSIQHRVTIKDEKYSVALFFEPKIDELIIPVVLNEKYQPVTYSTFLVEHLKYD